MRSSKMGLKSKIVVSSFNLMKTLQRLGNWFFRNSILSDCKTVKNKSNFRLCLAVSLINICEFRLILLDCITFSFRSIKERRILPRKVANRRSVRRNHHQTAGQHCNTLTIVDNYILTMRFASGMLTEMSGHQQHRYTIKLYVDISLW